MKTASAEHMQKANATLHRAQEMLDMHWSDEAGRAAYLAGFHAAHALVFEMTDRVPKTHSGLQTVFHQLARDNPVFMPEDLRFLNVGYNLKTDADYEIGPDAGVSQEDATEAVAMARRFLSIISALLPTAEPGMQQEVPS